jgi:threonine dehydrogenase-like Zn-dependent dehydrogenase
VSHVWICGTDLHASTGTSTDECRYRVVGREMPGVIVVEATAFLG